MTTNWLAARDYRNLQKNENGKKEIFSKTQRSYRMKMRHRMNEFYT